MPYRSEVISTRGSVLGLSKSGLVGLGKKLPRPTKSMRGWLLANTLWDMAWAGVPHVLERNRRVLSHRCHFLQCQRVAQPYAYARRRDPSTCGYNTQATAAATTPATHAPTAGQWASGADGTPVTPLSSARPPAGLLKSQHAVKQNPSRCHCSVANRCWM